MPIPPLDPDVTLRPHAPVASRRLEVFGAPVELVLVPSRKARQGTVETRPAVARSPAARIIADEAFWRHGNLAATPNLYPFAHDQRLLWSERALREPDLECWTAALQWAEQSGGSALHNTIGAAATIARAHVHLAAERLPFLATLPERRCEAAALELPDDCELLLKDVPFCLIGVRGPVAARAAALLQVAASRLTAACNVVAFADEAWFVPRRVETPRPWFPQPLGAAELWGRWCYVDEADFAAANAPSLQAALLAATMPPCDLGG